VASAVGVLVGAVLLLAAFPFLIWNESRAVTRARSLAEGAEAVVSIGSDTIDASNQGRLVHVTGTAATNEQLADPLLAVSANAVKLRRTAEMYQWVEVSRSETRNKLGGGTETVTTYEYKKEWSGKPHGSDDFKERGHDNPPMPMQSEIVSASVVRLGAFTLSREQVDALTDFSARPVDAAALEATPGEFQQKARVHDGGFYLGENPAAPAIGDLRIRFEVVEPGPVSTVAGQSGESFVPYATSAGSSIMLVESGTHSAADMFQAAQSQNTVLTWFLRFLGFFAMFAGIGLVLRPLRVIGDVVPLIGTLIGLGAGVVSAGLAFVLSLTTISIAWIAFRPLVGGSLLVVVVAVLAWMWHAGRRRVAQAPRVVPPPIPAA
jgi:hypothetical protein